MSITVDLGAKLEARVREAAAREGVTVDVYVRTLLDRALPGLSERPDPPGQEIPDLRPACGTHTIEEQVVKPFREWARSRGPSPESRPGSST